MSDKVGERTRPVSAMRRNRFWRNLFADPVRKLLALALAILLWIFLDSQITKSQEVQLKLIGQRSAAEAEPSEIRDEHIVVHPPAGYRVVGFRNHLTSEKITAVKVTFEAPQHQLRNLITNPGLEVRPRPSELNLRTSTITFDQDVLQAPDHRVVKAIRALEPRRIDAELERVEEKAVTLDKSMVRFVYPDSKLFPDFPERLRLEAAVFAPQQVRVQGPRSVTGDARNGAFLYHLDLSGFTGINEPRIVAQLTPEPLENVNIDGGPVTITIPLDPRFEPFEMTVPIMVDTASRTNPRADDFEHDPTMPVTVFASGDLVGVLSRMNDSELDDWVKRIARVHVLLEDDWRNEPQYMIGTFWLFDTRYERGRHYRTKTTLSVQIRPKTKH